jgi:hypothetical protein
MYIGVVALTAVAWAALMRMKYWGVVVAAGVLFVLPLIQYFAVIAVVPIVLSYMMLCDAAESRQRRQGVVSVLIVAAVTGALFAYAAFAANQIERSDGVWFGTSTLSSLPSAVSYAVFPPQYDLVGTAPMLVSLSVLAVIIGAVLWALFGRKETQLERLMWVGIAMIVVPGVMLVSHPIINAVTGFQFGNIYHHRMVLVATWLIPVSAYICVVAWASGRKRGILAIVAMAAILLVLTATYMSYGFMNVQTGHKELKGVIDAMPCDGRLMVHESPFSALPAKVMSEERGCPHEYIILTILTEREGRTSGFDVVPKDRVIYLFEEGWESKIPNGTMWFFKAGRVPHAFGNETDVYVEDGINLTLVVR